MILNVYAPNNGILKYKKQKNWENLKEMYNNYSSQFQDPWHW